MQPVSRFDDSLYSHLPAELRSLAARGVVRSYPKKAVLINEAETGDSLFVLLKGSCKVFAMDESGREITYSTIHEGDYFEPSTCAVVSRAAITEHLTEHPEFAMSLVVQVIRRARAATEAARNMALLDVYGRLVSVLEKHDGVSVKSENGSVTLESITHQEIASRVGASREMVSRLLKDLEKGGYIEMGTKRLVLLKKLPARW
jgi:CRP/FNR family transcriptional regulator, cyclic AMP receptor protein